MPMVKRGTGEFTKFRPLLSGVTGTGKTYSLVTFLYGKYDYWNEKEQSEAIEYASGKSMVILVCPGETGYRSLPADTEQLESYYQENDGTEEFRTVEYSRYAMNLHNTTFKEIEKNKPDILFFDGGHELYNHIFNDISDGEWLTGADMSINQTTGEATDKFRAARFHDTAQKTFINYLNMYYNSPIPLLGMTVWEEWKAAAQGEGDRPGGVATQVNARKYLWPALAGAMSIKMPGKFDARLSCQIRSRCLHGKCEESKQSQEHHVWQFLPRDDVMGVGIKGLRVSDEMAKKPFIHQTWPDLKNLLKRV
jgi:hypothetical protein